VVPFASKKLQLTGRSGHFPGYTLFVTILTPFGTLFWTIPSISGHSVTSGPQIDPLSG